MSKLKEVMKEHEEKVNDIEKVLPTEPNYKEINNNLRKQIQMQRVENEALRISLKSLARLL